MTLLIPQDVIKASVLSEDELLQEIILMLFQQDKISIICKFVFFTLLTLFSLI